MYFHLEDERVEVVGLSHVGKIRNNNEDSFAASIRDNIFLVADGMGGHAAGEVASAITAEQLVLAARTRASIADGILQAHQSICADAAEHRSRRSMGSTLVAARLLEDEIEVYWVGDSRAYLFQHPCATPVQISRDQTMAQSMLDAGEISAEQARRSPYRSLLIAALGSDNFSRAQICHRRSGFGIQSRLLLCSDGLTDMLTNNQIMTLVCTRHTLIGVAENLVAAALAAGGRDNVTVLLMRRKTSN